MSDATSVSAAGPYYWDNNGVTAGFGTAGGTWSATTTGSSLQGWSADSTGNTLPGNVTTATSDTGENFGSTTTGLAAGTVTVSGTVNSGPMFFATNSGAILLSGGTITLPAVASITLSNAVSDTINSALAGAGTSLTVAGFTNTTLVLGGVNIYTGSTLFAGPRVEVSTAANIPSSSPVTISSGVQLFTTAGLTLANSLTMSGIGYNDANAVNAGAIRVVNGDSLTGTITLAGNSRIGDVLNSAGFATSTISGQITGNYGLDFYGWYNGVVGTNTFILANTGTVNNYTGNTTIYNNYSNGSSSAGDNTVLKLGANEQIPNGPGAGLLVFAGYNANRRCTFELNGFNETVNGISSLYTGGNLWNVIENTTAGASTLTIGDGNSNSSFSGNITDGGVGATLALVKIGFGTLILSGTNSYVGGTTNNAGTLETDNGTALGGGMLIMNGGSLSNNVSATLTNYINLAVNSTIGVGNSQTFTIAGGISNSGSLTTAGAGTLALATANTYSGGTVVNGTVAPKINNCLGTGTVAVNAGGSLYNFSSTSLTFTNPVNLNGGNFHTGGGVSGTKNIWSGPVTLTASSSISSDGGTTGNSFSGGLNMGNSGYTFTINGNGNGSGSDNNFNSVISGGPNAIFMTGSAGVAHLNAANTYSGTNRSGFSLVLQNANAMQYATLDMNAADHGAVTLINNAVIGALTGSRDLNMGGFAVFIGNNNRSTTYSGAMTNNGSMNKVGAGTFTLTGVNTYPGSTFISAGTLALSGSGSLASTNIAVSSGATLDVSAANFTLAAGQALSNSASATANLVAPLNTGSGTISVSYLNGTPCFNIVGGTLNLSTSTIIAVRNTGPTLTPGTYKIISASGGGSVGGTTPSSVTVFGGPNGGTPSLSIMNGELYITVGGISSVSPNIGLYFYNGFPQAPDTVTETGSTGLVSYSYAGTANDSTPWGPTSTAPTKAGSYTVTATVAADANYFGATSSATPFVIGMATPIMQTSATASGITYGQSLSNSTLTVGSFTNSVGVSVAMASVNFVNPTLTPSAGTIDVLAYTAPIDAFNYVNVTNPVAVTVRQAGLTITANADSKKYDGNAYNTNNGVTYVGFVNGETNTDLSGSLSFSGSAEGAISAGSYLITPTGFTSTNYLISYISGTLIITQASISVGVSSTANPSGYKDGIVFFAAVPSDATGSVIFSSPSGAFSTNTVSLGGATSLSIDTLPRGTNMITAAYLGDSNYFGSTNTLGQVITNHPPVAGNASYTRNVAVNSFKVLVSNLLTNASDVDSDTLTLVSVGTTTNNATVMVEGGYVLYYNTNSVEDQFSYQVSDGYGGTNSAMVMINIDTTPLFGQSQVASVVGGTATLNFAGIPGYSYTVSRSTNFVNWISIWTTNAPTSGVFQFIDASAPTPDAYYQLRFNP